MMNGRQAAAGQHDAFTWFTQSQLPSVIRNGIVPEWFHGIISRKTSEDILMPKPPGYFLIRISETRIGYTLSYRAADRCRHFMIDVREDGQYIIVGENRYHQYLQDLVDFHRRNPIMPFSEVLTVACGQTSNAKTDYAELLFPKRHHKSRPPQNNFMQPSQSHPSSTEDIPPALPHRSNALCTSAAVPQVNTLYPNLEAEFQNVSPPQLPAMPVPKTRKRYLPESPQANIPPELPVRNVAPLYPNEACITAVSPPRSSSPLTTNESSFGASVLPKYQEGKQLVISNLKNFKKKFQKHRSNSQDNVYTEISPETDSGRGTDNEYQEIPRRQSENDEEADNYVSHSYINSDVTADGDLPPEYLHPPPFAPGY